MLQRGFRFEFEVPDDWVVSRDGSRLIHHGPSNEELIVSGFLVEGTGTPEQISEAHQKLLDNATRAVTRAAGHPDLETFKPFREDEGAVNRPLRCWTIISQTTPKDVLFSQAIVSSGTAILLVTLEGPGTPEQISVFRRLLKTIRPATAH
jgi:hypothetical protein